MNHFTKATAAIASLLIVGCTSVDYQSPSVATHPEYSVVVDSDFETTWSALINHVSGNFFSIDFAEKDSGLIALSFGAGNPEYFADCGTVDVSYMNPDYTSVDFDGPAVTYFNRYQQGRLDGKANLSARRISDSKTEVRVNARYVMSSKLATWVFDSGSSATQAVYLAGDVTCAPTYQVEKGIIESVQHLLRR